MSKELGFKFLNDVFDFYLGEIDRLEKKKGEEIISKDSNISEDYHDLFIFSVIDNKEIKELMKVIRVIRIVIDFENQDIQKNETYYNIFYTDKYHDDDIGFIKEIKTIKRQTWE